MIVPAGELSPHRLLIVTGHFGTGKTEFSVNLALALAREGEKVMMADLDIVNPYFRSRERRAVLESAGVRLITSSQDSENADMPSLPAEILTVLEDRSYRGVLDIGGDDRGALALGRYAPDILEENDYEMIFVANFYRPLTRSAEAALEVMREIEAAGKIPFTAIINNSNVAEETTLETVLATRKEAEKLSELSGLPVIATVAEKKIAEKIVGAYPIGLEEKYFEIKGE